MSDDLKLTAIRQRIDQLDEQIQQLIVERAEAAQEVACIKLAEDPDAVFQGAKPYCAWTPDSAWLVVSYGNRVDAVRRDTGEVKKVLEVKEKARIAGNRCSRSHQKVVSCSKGANKP